MSYASQDAEAAHRIASGLSEAGIAVWFDQSELRGGEAWDAMIRRRVRDCALFVPLISETTEARSEGYFRLEWKLAVDRSHLMSEDRAFIVPVVIDATHEAAARVPDAFRARQWSSLPGGEVTPEFVRQVAHLLDGTEPMPAPAVHAPRHVSVHGTSGSHTSSLPAASNMKPVWIGCLGLVAAVAAYAMLGSRAKDDAQLPTQTAAVEQRRDLARQPDANPLVRATPTPSVDAHATRERPSSAARDVRAESRADSRTEARPMVQSVTRPAVRKPDAVPAALTVTNDNQDGAIRFVEGRGIAAPVESKHWAMQEELMFWDTIKTSALVEDFEEYVRQYPEGRFAGLAKNRIKAIQVKRQK